VSKLFGGGQSIPQEDPNIALQRQREQQRAEDDKTKSTQEQLAVETRLRNRRYGVRSLFDLGGSAPKPDYLGSG
jgi:hypothetical protein